jgi:two-component system chemotaxis response regulator CheB
MPGSATRVLVVDDSVLIRSVLKRIFEVETDLEVVGVARDGETAIAKARETHPDVVTLDVEMPGMDGIETLRKLRGEFPRIRVIMFSSFTESGSEKSMEALFLGAADVACKPQGSNLEESLQSIREDLLRKVRGLGRARSTTPATGVPSTLPPKTTPASAPQTKPPLANQTPRRADILAIGVSTGGPGALATLFTGLPSNCPVPIVLVQHMPPMFTRQLAERLDKLGGPAVQEAKEGDKLRPGLALVAPGNFHMVLESKDDGTYVRLNQAPPENSCRPAADPLFRSVADIYGAHSLALILTGMGQDGLLGVRRIKAAGGSVLAQDEATSVVWGMPGAVAQEGLADQILALPAIAGEISFRLGRNRAWVPKRGGR